MSTKQFKVLSPIIWIGSRREIGETVEMTEAEAKNIGTGYLEAVRSEEAPKAEPFVEVEPVKEPETAPETEPATEPEAGSEEAPKAERRKSSRK